MRQNEYLWSEGLNWLFDCLVLYTAFNISVISQRQLTLFMSFLEFTSTTLGPWIVFPKETPEEKPRGPSVALTQDPKTAIQTLHH